jgi:hypothetical protein
MYLLTRKAVNNLSYKILFERCADPWLDRGSLTSVARPDITVLNTERGHGGICVPQFKNTI